MMQNPFFGAIAGLSFIAFEANVHRPRPTPLRICAAAAMRQHQRDTHANAIACMGMHEATSAIATAAVGTSGMPRAAAS